MTKELPPRRAIPAWKEANVRNEGLKNTKPKTLFASARGCGSSCSAWANFSRSRIWSRLKSARSINRFMCRSSSCGDLRERVAQDIDMAFVQYVGRQEA